MPVPPAPTNFGIRRLLRTPTQGGRCLHGAGCPQKGERPSSKPRCAPCLRGEGSSVPVAAATPHGCQQSRGHKRHRRHPPRDVIWVPGAPAGQGEVRGSSPPPPCSTGHGLDAAVSATAPSASSLVPRWVLKGDSETFPQIPPPIDKTLQAAAFARPFPSGLEGTRQRKAAQANSKPQISRLLREKKNNNKKKSASHHPKH